MESQLNANASGPSALLTRARRVEWGRIVLTRLIALLHWQQLVPLPVLWAAVAIGIYPLVTTAV